LRRHGPWQRLAHRHLHVSGRVLRGLAAESAAYSLFVLLREIEPRQDTFRCTVPGRGARDLPARRLRQRGRAGAEYCDDGEGNEMSRRIYSFVGTFLMKACTKGAYGCNAALPLCVRRCDKKIALVSGITP